MSELLHHHAVHGSLLPVRRRMPPSCGIDGSPAHVSHAPCRHDPAAIDPWKILGAASGEARRALTAPSASLRETGRLRAPERRCPGAALDAGASVLNGTGGSRRAVRVRVDDPRGGLAQAVAGIVVRRLVHGGVDAWATGTCASTDDIISVTCRARSRMTPRDPVQQ
jgi:hypothetical protein